MSPEYPPLPGHALARADADVAPEDVLWTQFVGELGRYGTCIEQPDGVAFRQRRERSSRTFAITPDRLRDALVRDLAYFRLKGEEMPGFPRIPQWFLDQLVEFVGSREEPYDHPYVVLVGTALEPSSDGVQPSSGAPDLLPDPGTPGP